MRLLSILFIVIGLVIEAVAAWAYASHWGANLWLLIVLLVHLLGAAVLTAGVYLALPDAYRQPRAGTLVFIATSAVCMPVIGPLGLATFMLAGLYLDYKEKVDTWDALAIPDLPFQPVNIEPNDVFLRDGLASVLSHFDDRNRRQRAIMACRHLPRRKAVPILRMGLADSADEVRLLAYAMLNTIERDLETQLGDVERAIAEHGDADGELHEERAKLFWEYSYLELSSGSVEAVLLGKAVQALEKSLAARGTAQRWLLRARICLVLESYDAAEDALHNADKLGLDNDDSAPRWAELAYKRRQFSRVAPALKRMSAEAGRNPTMRPVMEFWL